MIHVFSVRLGAILLLLSLVASSACAEDWRDDPDVIAARAASGAQATELYKKAIAKFPGEAQLHAELGLVLFDAGDYAGALTAYTRAQQLGWKPETAQLRIAKCHERLKQYAAAESSYRRALELDPGSAAAQFGLAAALFNQEKSAEALPYFEKLSQRGDEWGQYAQEYLLECYFDVKQYDRAAELARKLLEKKPDDPAFQWVLARSLYKSRKFAEALPLFRQQAGKNPKHAVAARYYAAICAENLNRYRDAENDYHALEHDQSDFGKEARMALERIRGKPWRLAFSETAGFDTGVILNDANGTPTKKKDGFNQTYLDVQGRVVRAPELSLWVGATNYSLLYPVLHENNYISNAATVSLELPGAGPVQHITVNYMLRYSEFDRASYRREHRVDVSGSVVNATQQIYFGFSAANNKFYGSAHSLSGPDGGFFFNYTHTLPGHDHLLRFFTDVNKRFSEDRASVRVTERAGLVYRSHLASRVYAELDETFRRDDFPQSRTAALERRIDRRDTTELNFDAHITKNVLINWGYLYEKQRSTQVQQQYTRNQVGAGISVRF